jgi:hypothetical protein
VGIARKTAFYWEQILFRSTKIVDSLVDGDRDACRCLGSTCGESQCEIETSPRRMTSAPRPKRDRHRCCTASTISNRDVGKRRSPRRTAQVDTHALPVHERDRRRVCNQDWRRTERRRTRMARSTDEPCGDEAERQRCPFDTRSSTVLSVPCHQVNRSRPEAPGRNSRSQSELSCRLGREAGHARRQVNLGQVAGFSRSTSLTG